MTSQRLTRRRFLALAGSTGAGILLAACAPASAPADSGSAGGQTTLVAWFTDRSTINRMTENEAIPDFESRNEGITVELQFVPEAELQQKLLTAKAAGNAPDVSSIDETFLDTLMKQEVLRPIPDEVIDVRNEMGELTAYLYRLPQGSDDGRYYGLPNGVFASQIYYNATLLDELGYSPEDIPTNWDDYLIWAKDITVWDGDTLERSGLAIFGNEYSMFEDQRYQRGGPLDGNVFPTKDSIRLADDIGVQSFQFVMDLYNVHRVDSIAEGLICRERFGTGRAVTMFQWSWFNGTMENQYADIDWGLVTPPTLSGDTLYGRRGPDVGFTLTTQNDNNLDAAITFYRYLISPDYLAKYCKLRGIQPSLKSMWQSPDFSDQAGPRWSAVAIRNRPENSVDCGFWPLELFNATQNTIPAIIRDEGEDIAATLKNAEDQGNEFLSANPQWSIISAADYEANPQWLTAVG